MLEEETTHTGFNPWQSPPSSPTTAPASWEGQIHEAGIDHLTLMYPFKSEEKPWAKAKKPLQPQNS